MILYVVISAFVVFQIWVTWRVWRDDSFIRSEKSAQTKLVWLVPLLGAILVYSMLSDERKHQT